MLAQLLAGAVLYITGFTCDPAHGQNYCGKTASGVQVGPGVAACPPDVPFGTALVIEGVGKVVCLDSYAPSLSPRIDVWEPSIAECFAITGRHRAEIVGVPEGFVMPANS